MKKIRKRPIILFFIAVIALYVIIYIVPKVTGALVSSYTATYGELKICDETDGWLVRNEQVYTAGSGGSINRYIKADTLIRKGTSVMEISGGSGEDDEVDSAYTELLSRLGSSAVETENYTAEEGGIVCYYADGYEGKLTPETMEKGGLSYYSKVTQDAVTDLKRDTAVKGEPLFKIVDRTRWYLVCFVEERSAERYEEGQEIQVAFEDDQVRMDVKSVEKMDGKARIILETDYYYSGFARTRTAKVSLITYENRGLIVENGSITEEKGQKGVYVKVRSGNFVFVPIEIYKSNEEYSLVADGTYYDDKGELISTVEIYDEVLKDPN